jgi:hypothetical protein
MLLGRDSESTELSTVIAELIPGSITTPAASSPLTPSAGLKTCRKRGRAKSSDDPIWPTTSISFARMGMLQAIYKDDEPHFGPGKHAGKEPH